MVNDKVILLVEDDADDALVIQRAFRRAGFHHGLNVVSDGHQAVDYLSGSGAFADREKYPLPFLVLLDLRMAGFDGFDVLSWIRSEPGLSRLLVVVLTSSNLQADVDRAYELGANSYLVKPLAFDEMTHLLQRFEIYWTEINRVPTAPLPKSVRSETSAH